MEQQWDLHSHQIVANIFMEDFESTTITTADRQLRVWYCYVDDTLLSVNMEDNI